MKFGYDQSLTLKPQNFKPSKCHYFSLLIVILLILSFYFFSIVNLQKKKGISFIAYHYPLGTINLPILIEFNFTNPFLQKFDYFHNYQYCENCLFQPSLKGNSKNNDVILSLLVGNLYGLTLSIKTLRTVGCRASLIIFTNNITYLSIRHHLKGARLQHLMGNCGVSFIIISKIPQNFRCYDFIRIYSYYQFLAIRKHLIDRVLMFDIYDTIFQGDPFSDDIDFDGIGFTQDSILLEKDAGPFGYQSFFHTILNYKYDPIIHGKQNMINSGVVFGRATHIVSFLENLFFPPLLPYLTNTSQIINSWQWFDQGYLNVIMWSDWFPNKKDKFVFFQENNSFISIYHLKEEKLNCSELGKITVINSKYPARLIHQYDRKPGIVEKVQKKCFGKLDTNKTFIRKVVLLEHRMFHWN